MNWTLDERRRGLLAFARHVFAIRRLHASLRRRTFFRGSATTDGRKDVAWMREDGREMTEPDWGNPQRFVVGMLLDGRAATERDDRNQPVIGDTLLLVLNSSMAEARFTLPALRDEGVWVPLVDTAGREAHHAIHAGWVCLAPHSLVLLRHGLERRRPAPSGNDVGTGGATGASRA